MREEQDFVAEGWILLEWTEDGTLTVQGMPQMLLKNTNSIEEVVGEAFPRRTIVLDEAGKEVSTVTDVREIGEILRTHRISERQRYRHPAGVRVRPYRRQR